VAEPRSRLPLLVCFPNCSGVAERQRRGRGNTWSEVAPDTAPAQAATALVESGVEGAEELYVGG